MDYEANQHSVYLIRADDRTHPYKYNRNCVWNNDTSGDWVSESKNGTCYNYSDWDKYAIGNCTNAEAVEYWQHDRRMKHTSFLSRTIAGSVGGTITGILAVFGVVYWRRQRNRRSLQKHGLVVELHPIELDHRIKPSV